MTHRKLFQALFLSLLTVACSGAPPTPLVESEDMAHGDDPMLLYEDPFEMRARGNNQPVPSRIVEPIAPRQGPWSGNNQLGITQPFLPAANNRQTILKLDEWGMPQVWTVMLGLEFDEDEVIVSSRLKVRADIAIGSGGTVQKVSMDWGNGVSFSAPMNAINVEAFYEQAVDIDDIDLRLTVTIGQFAGGTYAPVLTSRQSTPPGVGTPFDIPSFARRVSILPGTPVAAQSPYQATVTIDFLDISGVLVLSTVVGTDILSFSEGIPIPANAYSMAMNYGGAGPAAVVGNFIFHLDL